MNVEIDQIGGNCPVQAEGTIDGRQFYFRARGMYWSLEIGAKDDAPYEKWDCGSWCFSEKYSDDQYAAGWMTHDEARAFIEKAAGIFEKWQRAA